MHSHAMVPTPFDMGDGRLRIYLSFRDAGNISRVGFVDVDAANPLRVLRVSETPSLDIGEPGGFDDNGVLCTSVVRLDDGRLMMYYVGFELSTHIRYRLLTGAAISEDGEHFVRIKPTAILERSPAERYFRGGPFVMREQGIFRMWYVAGSSWLLLGGKQMPVYELRYLESEDGIHWPDQGETVLATGPDEHGFGRPWVVKEDARYQLHYSARKIALQSYRLGYAESADGIRWQRQDEQLGLDVSAEGWDSEAIMYSAVIRHGANEWLFYNGNNFGETGFGVALREPE
ncbi:hypothetical protein GCM10025770_33000 [Viridibacterium curvum]|uniref:Uncharacterized protein n=2 Tax=Viridibacterium curvum TaxID=1101404 RepID=A0ABP9R0R0_9RHOO